VILELQSTNTASLWVLENKVKCFEVPQNNKVQITLLKTVMRRKAYTKLKQFKTHATSQHHP